MHSMRIVTVVVLFALLLSSCVVPKQITGFYDADNGDSLRIKRDGEMLWSPLSKTTENSITIGFVNYKKKTGALNFITASASLFIFTKLKIFDKKTKIEIFWSEGSNSGMRATVYTKRN